MSSTENQEKSCEAHDDSEPCLHCDLVAFIMDWIDQNGARPLPQLMMDLGDAAGHLAAMYQADRTPREVGRLIQLISQELLDSFTFYNKVIDDANGSPGEMDTSIDGMVKH